MSLCKECISGVRHEGTPEGKVEQIGGIETYVGTPAGDYPKDKVLLFLSDVFGLALVNNKLLVDDFARNGFYTVMPDLFKGDPIPEDAFNSPNYDIMSWMGKHGFDTVTPIVDAVVAALKEKGITRIGTTGYCFGAPPAFDLAYANVSHVTVISHPSALATPDAFEKYLKQSKAPLLINSCETDPQFGPDKQKVADEVLGDGKFAPGYVRTYYEGCTHGFCVRGDMSDPKVKAGKEGAFKTTVEFLIKYL